FLLVIGSYFAMGRMSGLVRFSCISLWIAEGAQSGLWARVAPRSSGVFVRLVNGDRLDAARYRLALRRAGGDEPPGNDGGHDQEEGGDHQRYVESVHEGKAERVVYSGSLLRRERGDRLRIDGHVTTRRHDRGLLRGRQPKRSEERGERGLDLGRQKRSQQRDA